MVIRTATSADWPGIWPFWHQIAVAGETIAWDPRTSYDRARAYWLSEPPTAVYVAETDGAIVGSYTLRPNYGPASRVANCTYIVDPDRAGHGIGRRLVLHSLDEARAAGFRSMVFNAVVETNIYAVHLYESLGFTIVGTIPEAFDHAALGPVGLHIMYRPL
jgi:ribosomal protein S18 acetylase RimI-like enzyme